MTATISKTRARTEHPGRPRRMLLALPIVLVAIVLVALVLVIVSGGPPGWQVYALGGVAVVATGLGGVLLVKLLWMHSQLGRSVDSLTLEANTDHLTDLPNYRAFQQSLERINDNRAYSEAIAVLFIDIDQFKGYNDQYGHHAGDLMLRTLAERLQAAVRPGDLVFRVGGDEFVVILTELGSLTEARQVAERIIIEAGVSVRLVDKQKEVSVSVSVGLAYSAHRETDLAALVIDADRSMLDMKKLGRRGGGSVSISPHRSSRINDVVARAIDEQLLTVVYQPIVNILEDRIWGFEALVRYTDPDVGPVSPSSLVDKAKRLGRMDALTRQVIEQAMDAAVQFRQVAPTVTMMAVNLEAKQILPTNLGDFLQGVPKRFPGVDLCLELNERSLRVVSEELRLQAVNLRGRGLMIALDDYGAEQSSVGALVRLPMDVLKLDRTLVPDLDDVRQREMVKALRGYMDTLGHAMVVEGVENESAAGRLRALGVTNAQGFYFGRPAPRAAVIERLERGLAAVETPAEYAER
ncbi:bifunctional diguanylate cyclase/phosphodiesterase [Homoserinimonas sp. OAct 916]|uniref:putative bifunctional diguanylate cyclase/phosphodiesterase n=1 Tax=Homoserinimonas sp. OAct 916 TaxID=2211450 RepID=UPI00130032D9|nr:EAL domain-containing protein [Homoserinimonas sp. OAct 916]